MWLTCAAVALHPYWILRIEVRKFNSEGLSDLGISLYSTVKHRTEMSVLSHDYTISETQLTTTRQNQAELRYWNNVMWMS